MGYQQVVKETEYDADTGAVRENGTGPIKSR